MAPPPPSGTARSVNLPRSCRQASKTEAAAAATVVVLCEIWGSNFRLCQSLVLPPASGDILYSSIFPSPSAMLPPPNGQHATTGWTSGLKEKRRFVCVSQC